MQAHRHKSAAKGKGPVKAEQKTDKKPTLEEFLAKRDYTGCCVLLEVMRHTPEANAMTLPWLAYCYFHNQDYRKAAQIIDEILAQKGADAAYHLYKACCLFYMGQHREAEAEAAKGPQTRLQNRINLHVAHKLGDESKTGDDSKLVKASRKLSEDPQDQLSLASVHYLRSHYQEATDIYKRLLLDNREWLALQVYVALCYYKLDYYDVSLEILSPYLTAMKDAPEKMSAIAINLKACNHYKLYDGKAAEAELKPLMDILALSSHNNENSLVQHNLAVFRNGEGALQVLPPLVDVIPEARLNLVIYYLRHNEIKEAYDLMKDVETSTPQEYILKGVCNAAYGQLTDSRELLKLAQQLFQVVGASQSECDTIPGRQCMASCFFILKQFEDVLIYLNSVKAYSLSDPAFNWNYGIALASCEQYKDAEDAFVQVVEERLRQEYAYTSWLARCFIMNGKPRDAWELYLKMDSSNDSFSLLVLIANDCYKVGSFYYAAKAFDVLERLDPSPEYGEGKRGACCGVFQQVIARKEKKECMRDIVNMLRTSHNNPQRELFLRSMVAWCQENGVMLDGEL